MRHTRILLLLVLVAGCRTPGTKSGTLAGEGPAQTRPGWIKSPEAIEGTITQAWGVQVTEKERWRYLQSVYSMIGGTLVLNTKSLVDQPNELFALGLDNLSGWLSLKLVEKQTAMAATGKAYMFEGLGFSTPDAGNCFKDDAKDWCDFLDGVAPDSLTKAGVNPAALSKEWKKRVMHNIQDTGEFMLLAIDNTLMMPGGKHAAQFLLDDVFLPVIKGGGAVTVEKEKEAWRAVVHAILMSGGFYLEAPADGGTP